MLIDLFEILHKKAFKNHTLLLDDKFVLGNFITDSGIEFCCFCKKQLLYLSIIINAKEGA